MRTARSGSVSASSTPRPTEIRQIPPYRRPNPPQRRRNPRKNTAPSCLYITVYVRGRRCVPVIWFGRRFAGRSFAGSAVRGLFSLRGRGRDLFVRRGARSAPVHSSGARSAAFVRRGRRCAVCSFIGSTVRGLFVRQGTALCGLFRLRGRGPRSFLHQVARSAAGSFAGSANRARDGNSYSGSLRMSSPRPAPMRTSAR